MMTKKTYDIFNKVVRDEKGHFQKAQVFKVDAWSSADAVRKHLGHKNFHMVPKGSKFQLCVSLSEKRRDRKSYYAMN